MLGQTHETYTRDHKLIDDIVTVMTELTKNQNPVEQICGVGSSEIQEGLEKIGVPCPGNGVLTSRVFGAILIQ